MEIDNSIHKSNDKSLDVKINNDNNNSVLEFQVNKFNPLVIWNHLTCKSQKNKVAKNVIDESPQIPIFKNPIPLNNNGNTCYINSSFQALVPSFNRELKEALRSARSYDYPSINLLNTYMDKLENGKNSWSPGNSIRNLKYFSSSLRNGAQEDAQEFLNGLLDRLREEFDKIDSYKGANNPIRNCFSPMYDARYFCCSCQMSNIKSPQIQEDLTFFLDLSDNIQSMINAYLKSSNDSYNCKNCHKNGLARMNAAFTSLPKTFICCVKRFNSFHMNNVKISREIELSERIKLPYYDEDNNRLFAYYDLSAVVMHLGSSLNNGHYECVSRLNNQWYRISDSSIMSTNKFNVQSYTKSSSYIYIFSRSSSQCSIIANPALKNSNLNPLKRKNTTSNHENNSNKFGKFDNNGHKNFKFQRNNYQNNNQNHNGHKPFKYYRNNQYNHNNFINKNIQRPNKNNSINQTGNNSNRNNAILCPNS